VAELKWADDELRGMETAKGDSWPIKALKVALFFADEAAIVLIVGYVVYRYFW